MTSNEKVIIAHARRGFKAKIGDSMMCCDEDYPTDDDIDDMEIERSIESAEEAYRERMDDEQRMWDVADHDADVAYEDHMLRKDD